jgi:hypothetical protein
MGRFQSDLITPANCRKILRAWHSGGLRSLSLFAGTNSFDLGDLRVEVEGEMITVERFEKGMGRDIREDEVALLELRFRRVLKHASECVVKSRPKFAPLAVDRDSLIALLAIVLAGVPVQVRRKAERAVCLALEKPGIWLQKYGRDRGLKRPTKHLHVIAFLDALIDARAAAELDHRSEPDELAREVRKIGRRMGFDIAAPQDSEIAKALGTLRGSLKHVGWALIIVEINSDSYPLFAVPEANIRQVQALMRKVGFQVANV